MTNIEKIILSYTELRNFISRGIKKV